VRGGNVTTATKNRTTLEERNRKIKRRPTETRTPARRFGGGGGFFGRACFHVISDFVRRRNGGRFMFP